MDAELVQLLQHPLRGLEGLEDTGQDWLARAVKRYLSVAHRDNLDGCGYPAVASEIASAPGEVRRAFANAIEKRVAAFEPHTHPMQAPRPASASSPPWPGSFFEFTKIVGPLTDPVKFGGSATDAFDVVAISLPGFGSSGKRELWTPVPRRRRAQSLESLLQGIALYLFCT